MDTGNKMEPLIGTFHDVATGEIVVRELTPEEVQEFYPNGLPEVTYETPADNADALPRPE
jgi:hypothetical protein